MINSIGNQGVPQPGPLGAPGRDVSQTARGDERTGGLKRGHHIGRGFMRGHHHVQGGEHGMDRPELTDLEKAALRAAHDAKVRYLQDQATQGGPAKIDRARFSAESMDMLSRDASRVDGGGPSGGGGAVAGGPVGPQPADPGDGPGDGALAGGSEAQLAPPTDDGPSGPTYTARRA